MAFILAMAFIFIAQKLNKYGFNLLSAEISPVYIEKSVWHVYKAIKKFLVVIFMTFCP